MLSLLPILVMFSSAAATPTTTVRAQIVDEEIRVVAAGREPVVSTRRTLYANGRIRRETSLDSTVILLRSKNAVPLALLDLRAATWFGYETAVLAKAGLQGGPLLEGLGVDESGATFGPAEPFRTSGTKEAVGPWDATLFTATVKGPGGMETAVWLADRPTGIANDTGLATMRSVYSKKGGPLEPYFESLAKLPGFPVRWVFRMTYPNGVKSVATITVTKIHEEEVPASQFEIPAGATRIADPVGILNEGK